MSEMHTKCSTLSMNERRAQSMAHDQTNHFQLIHGRREKDDIAQQLRKYGTADDTLQCVEYSAIRELAHGTI